MVGDNGAQRPQGKRPRRSGGGFRRASLAAEPALAGAGAKRGFAEHRLLTQWRPLMGAEFGAACRPLRISWRGRETGAGATLVVEASGARAPEVQHDAPRIAERVNQILGWRAVARVKVVQSGGAAALAEPEAPFEAAPRLDAAPSSDISAIEDAGLRGALARLEAHIRSRGDARLTDALEPRKTHE